MHSHTTYISVNLRQKYYTQSQQNFFYVLQQNYSRIQLHQALHNSLADMKYSSHKTQVLSKPQENSKQISSVLDHTKLNRNSKNAI